VGTPAAGEVVLVPFPFSDLSQSKVRPAVCLADAGRGDWVLCQITSRPYGDSTAIPLDAPDFGSGGLLVASFARPGKLFTVHAGLMVRSVGVLTPAAFARVLSSVGRYSSHPQALDAEPKEHLNSRSRTSDPRFKRPDRAPGVLVAGTRIVDQSPPRVGKGSEGGKGVRSR